MADINASLKEALNGKAPQHKKKGQSTFEFSEGSDGALHTKVTDENGTPIDPRKVELPTDYPDSAVKAELQEIKQQQADILARLDNPIDTQLTGSNVEDLNAVPTRAITRQELEVLVDSEVLEAGADTGVKYLNPKGAKEIYLFIQIDKQPWSLRYRNQFGSVAEKNGFPVLDMVETTHGRAIPAISYPIGYNDAQGMPAPSNMKEAKDWGLPITSNEYYRVYNHSDEDATVSVNIMRIWR